MGKVLPMAVNRFPEGGDFLKLIVMSDSHGVSTGVQHLLELHKDADLFIHLGDGEREVNRLLQVYPWFAEKLLYLKGNCDSGVLVPQTQRYRVYTLPFGHRLFAAHGDYYRVKYSTARIAYEARQHGCDLVLYGHTHVRDCRYEDGLYILNPGSLGCPRDGKPPSYAVVSVSEKGLLPNVTDL